MPTYNIVQEGADKTGGTAIDSVLGDLVGSDTTIRFPKGTYKFNGLTVPAGMNNLKLIAPNGARLIPAQSGDNLRWFDVSGNGFVLDGFELDMRNTPIPPYVRMNSNAADWELRRLITRGHVPAATDTNVGTNDSSDARTYFRLAAAGGSRGLIQDCYFHEGSCEPNESSNRRCVLVESGNGNLTFNRCWFEQWAGTTIYAKKPRGAIRIYNCFFRNTQNCMRLGGNSEVYNSVSIKNAQHPIQGWSGGSLQRGVNVEATDPTNLSQEIDSYNGTLTINECDFNHRYLSPSCGGAITAGTPCQNIVVKNTRISYDSSKNHDAIYTSDGQQYDGTPANLELLQLENVQVRNDHDSEYAIYIGQVPDSWGAVSGVLGGTGLQTNSSYISNRMTINGNPTPPNTTPPLASPPPLGKVPMQSAQLVRIDNTGNSTESTFRITAGTTVLPAGNDGAAVTRYWGEDGGPTRPGNATVATGTVPADTAFAFYVTGGIVSTEADGPAEWTVDGEPYTPGKALLANRITTGRQESSGQWQQATAVVQPDGVVIAKPLSFNGSDPTHVRLRNVDNGNFEYKLEEWLYLDGPHTQETFSALSAEPNERVLTLDSGESFRMKAGRQTVSLEATTVSLGSFFGSSAPVVLAQSQTFNGGDPIVTRLSDVSSSSFGVRVQEEEEEEDGHTNEEVGYIALQQKTGQIDGQQFEVRQTGNVVSDQWRQVTFNQEYESPRFIAAMQTFNGKDTAEIRYRNLTGSSVEIKIEEEQSVDSETTHVSENVGFAVFEESS